MSNSSRYRGRIRLWGLLAGAWVLGLPARGAADQTLETTVYRGRILPHPTVILAIFEGKAYPVIGVSGEFPQIALAGSTKTLRSSNQAYQPMRAAAYAPGLVRITNETASTFVTTNRLNLVTYNQESGGIYPLGDASYSGKFTCSVEADEDHPDCYVVVLFYRRGADGLPLPDSVRLGFGQLANLKAGQPKIAKITQSYSVPKGDIFYYLPMVFSRGLELRSNFSSGTDLYFHRQEAADHQRLVEQYVNKFKGVDHPAVPYLQIPLRLPDGVNPRSQPPDLKATFSVDESGGVESVQLAGELPGNVQKVLTEEIEGWMFLPRLKQGNPVRTLVTLPLSFN